MQDSSRASCPKDAAGGAQHGTPQGNDGSIAAGTPGFPGKNPVNSKKLPSPFDKQKDICYIAHVAMRKRQDNAGR